MSGSLVGVRVLDFSWVIAGPFGTGILADLGAEVIKLEPVGLSERDRGFGPYVGGMSTFRFGLDRGKKSMAIDLRKPEGRQLVYQLVPHMDAVVENFTPGTMARLEVDYETLRQYNPRLVYLSSSAYGQYGPYRDERALDIMIQAVSGLLSQGEPAKRGSQPVTTPVPMVDLSSGIYIAVAILAALYERERSGLGQYIDMGMLDCALSLMENVIIRYSARHEVKAGRQWDTSFVWPHEAFRAKDAWMVIAQVTNWKSLCEKIGRPDLGEDPRYQTNSQRAEHKEVLEPELENAFVGRPVAEWRAELEGFCSVTPVNTIDKVLEDPQVKARNAILSLPVPPAPGKEVLVPNSPFSKMSRTPGQPQGPAPIYQQHTDQVLRDILGLSDAELEALERAGVIGRLRPEGQR
ncbi:MAG TPA: CaiB/BaiF CoA-transferase family protein [Dehalococcoidia bacterium]|nr:CaiB/BaiF CoA-transferase family protein [Dehalococcoidia bacterium]